jgi:hypothetical protein
LLMGVVGAHVRGHATAMGEAGQATAGSEQH